MSLVDLGKRLLDAAKRGETEELGTSPLHFSAQYGHIETAEVLLRAGISRDARTKVDRTPLHVAAQEGHVDIVELLKTIHWIELKLGRHNDVFLFCQHTEIAGITEGESITIETTEATEEVQEVETETETETIETVVTTTDSMLTDSLTKKILPVQLIQNISTSKGEESEYLNCIKMSLTISETVKIKKVITIVAQPQSTDIEAETEQCNIVTMTTDGSGDAQLVVSEET
ncbi:hypothetical protein KUTeg_015746 [Tegillarca granosa]|uniref:Uncharacterized protein n=1 Tax=Tegillarca granosa TaxID=220873 RepID=A0ABQ9ETI1_TEGGR|nr:hypothetical protein KUTeg_015746 [Tegillarca granosa]